MKYLSLALLIVLFTACRYSNKVGSGNITTETRNVSGFTSISVSQSIEVDIQQGNQTAVTVEADDNIISYVETVNDGGNLKIRLKDLINTSNATIRVHVIAPNIDRFSASSAAEIVSKGMITSPNKVDIQASSSGKITLELEAPAVSAKASSGANITASGRTKDVKVDASSGSEVNFQSLQAETANANASSGSSIDVFASVSVDASSSSGSNIEYTGGAASIKKNESSGGSVSNK